MFIECEDGIVIVIGMYIVDVIENNDLIIDNINCEYNKVIIKF